MDHQYPEQKPATSQMETFTFDISRADTNIKALEARKNKLKEVIDEIDQRIIVNNIKPVSSIIALTDNPEELVRLGNALIKVSEVLPELKKAEDRLNAAQLAKKDPQWLAAVFGNFEAEFHDEELINKLEQLKGNE